MVEKIEARKDSDIEKMEITKRWRQEKMKTRKDENKKRWWLEKMGLERQNQNHWLTFRVLYIVYKYRS